MMIDKFAAQLAEEIGKFFTSNDGASEAKPASQLKAVVEAALGRLNLVTREEFDAQQVVLKRTREKLEKLEAQVAALESQSSA